MSMNLFEHNQKAYTAAISVLEATGKAAIVHPTGTGKSFIGFKLCEQHPDKRVCWLSPSSYIFETQLEGLRAASDGYVPENIDFFTYAKLSLLSMDELYEIKPDYIILDEFHRCGAPTWGVAVNRFLKIYPDAPVLGLSATNVRYLDGQRDMAMELFDGNIASEMTLGEAVVSGILSPPKYVLSVYSYQKELEKYRAKVRRARSREVREKAEAYLEELRRSLESAIGLDELFEKHMPDPRGKYIVFCANLEHMQQMIAKIPEWFGRVDRNPAVYTVYSDDPSADKSFREFKENSDSGHLRLLYCIDALNEGVHVKDISGVILLRPTVSPIIYKQQIGRAMSASANHEVVIFDIVMNIDNLYTISMVEYEMENAISYFVSQSQRERIVNQQFRIIDEVRDCRTLFNQLNDTLSASWELMFERARAYYEANGNLNVPRKYKTPEGYSLGEWLTTQRKVYKGMAFGILTERQKKKLDSLGMRWESGYLRWENYYQAAKRYYEKHGNLAMSSRYVTEDGIYLGKWISNIRSSCSSRETLYNIRLTDEQREKLSEIGMIWDSKKDYLWEEKFAQAQIYYNENGHLNVPVYYVSPTGVMLGNWISNLRKLYRKPDHGGLSRQQIERLESIGMLWLNRIDISWYAFYNEAKKYYEEYGNLAVAAAYISPDGTLLGRWINRQREAYAKGKLDKEKVALLEDIAMLWSTGNAGAKKHQS